MRITDLFQRKLDESEWHKGFMTSAMRTDRSFSSAEELSKFLAELEYFWKLIATVDSVASEGDVKIPKNVETLEQFIEWVNLDVPPVKLPEE